jgi:thiamine biosynthesis protein ThiI
VERRRSRIMVLGELDRLETLEDRLSKIAGLHSFSRGYRCSMEIEALKLKVEEALMRSWDGEQAVTFKISTKRSNKKFPMSAVELNTLMGAHLVQKHGEDKLKVKLKEPQIDISIEIQNQETIVFESKVKGIGGLPVGTAGRVLCLLSGGIDSPVAAFQMMRRGCAVDYVFFENRVFLGRAAYDKVRRLAEILGQFQPKSRLHVVPFTDIQVAIRDHCTDRHRVVLYRRYMYRIADVLAKKFKYHGLVNGESLGQVASQTLENIQAVNTVVDHCVYRPLICMDKVDITNVSRKIGAYEVSIEDAPDCCSVFMPPKPVTRAKIPWLLEDEEKLESDQLIEEAIEKMEVLAIEGV